MISAYLYGVIAIGLIIPFFTLHYISRVRSLFSGVPRLDRPWLLLEVGVVLLLASLLVTAISDSLAHASSLLRPLGNLLLVLTAFFVLYAMATMKRAWTISETD